MRQAPSAVAQMGVDRRGSNVRVSRDARDARNTKEKLTEAYTGGGTTGPAHVPGAAGAFGQKYGVHQVRPEGGVGAKGTGGKG